MNNAHMNTEPAGADFRAMQKRAEAAEAERDRLHGLINTAHTADFLEAVRLEKAHQCDRFGLGPARSKSAENWFWLVGYLSGKCLRAVIEGDKEKALHHTISSAAALANWHEAIAADRSGSGKGADADIRPFEIDADIYQRMVAYNDDAHDLQSSNGINSVVNHFLRLGIERAETERDAHTQELF